MTPQAFSYATLSNNGFIYVPPFGLTESIDYMLKMDPATYKITKIQLNVNSSCEKWQHGIVYRNITGENVDTSISFDFDYESGLKPTNKSATPALSNVLLENIQFKNSVNMAGEFNGLPESPFVNITLRNVTTTGRSSGKFGHCDNVVNAICEGMDQEQCPPCFKNE